MIRGIQGVVGQFTPSLNLDFTKGVMPSGMTYTRSGVATRVNASGILETVLANVPRFDYDPVTLQLKGLLIEEARTNVLLQSATLASQNVTVTAQVYTLSFYGTGSITRSGTSTGTLLGSGTNARVTVSFTPTAGTLTLTVSGSVTSAQLEAGSFATSYIPTTTAAAVRGADVLTMPTAGWYNVSEGTFLCRFTVDAAGVDIRPLTVNDGTNNNRMVIQRNSSNQLVAFGVSAGVNIAFSSVGVSGLTTGAMAGAIAYKVNDYRLAVNGTVLSPSANTAPPPVVTTLTLNTSGGRFWHTRIAYWPTRRPNAYLQSITV
ncbi:hypothetical protein [Fibrivirga algicola]|uniref:Uncharacterized protein n=1 Tax=Fibrivirga algicola TaxID=2950420 RepID=A0ABX0QET4_9BACT|nr:hypothetical protein [Fibrivirga algicola]NID09373.1 hypothetical protein [Fibrivirga algicola]